MVTCTHGLDVGEDDGPDVLRDNVVGVTDEGVEVGVGAVAVAEALGSEPSAADEDAVAGGEAGAEDGEVDGARGGVDAGGEGGLVAGGEDGLVAGGEGGLVAGGEGGGGVNEEVADLGGEIL